MDYKKEKVRIEHLSARIIRRGGLGPIKNIIKMVQSCSQNAYICRKVLL